jgi:K+-sensing histidine kinase KdpD
MRLVMFSLLSNAVRRSASGDVVKVRLNVEDDNSVKLEIADRGAEQVSLDAVLADPVRMLDGHDGDAGMELPLAMAILRCHDGQLQSAPSGAGDMVASIKLPASRLVSAPRPARAVGPVETAMRKAG